MRARSYHSFLLSACLCGSSCASTGKPSPEQTQLYDQAYDQFQLNNFAAARETLRRSLQKYPGRALEADTKLLLANCESQLGNLAAAEALYDEVLEAPRDDTQRQHVLENLGALHMKQKRYDSAAAAFRRAVALEKDVARQDHLRYSLGVALQRAARFADARTLFEGIVRRHPSSEVAVKAAYRLDLPDHFTVKIGVYGQPNNAERQKRKLAEAGFPARVDVLRKASGTTRHYVLVGASQRREDAEELKRQIDAAKVLDPRIETEIVP